MELNERLRELRKEQGETQKQVAAAIGIGSGPTNTWSPASTGPAWTR